jgi:hypothetical protein
MKTLLLCALAATLGASATFAANRVEARKQDLPLRGRCTEVREVVASA